MLTRLQVSLITLGVDDLSRAIRFYSDLGMRRIGEHHDEIAFFDAGGRLVFALFGRAALAADAALPATPRAEFGGITLAYNVRDETTVDNLLVAAVKAGGRLLKPAHRASWGGYSGYFADPDGHPWEVAHNPSFHMDEEGRLLLPAYPG